MRSLSGILLVGLLWSDSAAHAQDDWWLEIQSEPSGALVVLDAGRRSERSLGYTFPPPSGGVSLSPAECRGRHSLTFTREGYETLTIPLRCRDGQIRVTLTRTVPGPAECAALASSPDYPGALSVVIQHYEWLTREYEFVVWECPPTEWGPNGSETCVTTIRRCQGAQSRAEAGVAAALAMVHGSGWDEYEIFRGMRALVSAPLAGQRFAMPRGWDTYHPDSIMLAEEECDPALFGREAISRRSTAFAAQAGFLRDALGHYQRWWDWARGICGSP